MDMSKAYDRIKWDFLHLVLQKLGFSTRWVNMIMICVESMNLNLCLLGNRVASFKLEKGLRQGNPLSPYLFILVSEILSSMIEKFYASGKLKRVQMSTQCPIVIHSFFADDALFIMNANQSDCRSLARILKIYYDASSQVANLDKSSIFFSENTPIFVRNFVCTILGINEADDTLEFRVYGAKPSIRQFLMSGIELVKK